MVVLTAGLITPTTSFGSRPMMQPPSSLKPSGIQHRVLVTHRHRRVRACVKVSTSGSSACLPQFGQGDTATTVYLEPLLPPDDSASHSRRVAVVFKSAMARQEQAIQLTEGTWSVDWPGASGAERLRVSADKVPRVRLLTTSGRCELMTTTCAINERSIDQRVFIDD